MTFLIFLVVSPPAGGFAKVTFLMLCLPPLGFPVVALPRGHPASGFPTKATTGGPYLWWPHTEKKRHLREKATRQQGALWPPFFLENVFPKLHRPYGLGRPNKATLISASSGAHFQISLIKNMCSQHLVSFLSLMLEPENCIPLLKGYYLNSVSQS